MHSIALVQTLDQHGTNVILPYAIGVLWQEAMTSEVCQANWQLTDVVYKKEDITITSQRLAENDVVCFSTYVWNYQYQVDLARAIKTLNSDCFIVFGGPHIHENFKDFWIIHADVMDMAVVGEGDISFKTLLEQWPNIDPTNIPGAWTTQYYAGKAQRLNNLESHAHSPYLSGFYNSIIQQEVANGKLIEAVLQTNRGCPYHCTFCEEGLDYKNKIHSYTLEKVKQEIHWMGENKIEMLDIADNNFGIMDHDLEIMECICQTKQRYGYPKVFDATYAKNAQDRVLKIAQLDHQYGTGLVRGITLALQSNNPGTLKAIKRFNLVDAKQQHFLKKLNELGTPVYVEMIWPLPHETYQTFIDGIEQSLSMGMHKWLEVNRLWLMPSTELQQEYQPYYQLADDGLAVISNNNLTAETVDRGYIFYTFLTALYYFGFGRLAIEYLHAHQGWQVTEFVQRLIVHPAFSKTHSKLLDLLNTLAKDKFCPDPRQLGWRPYTHLASWLQQDLGEFLLNLKLFLIDNQVPAQTCEDIIQRIPNSIARYQQPSEFKDFVDFCQYYYWYNRKKGLSYLH